MLSTRSRKRSSPPAWVCRRAGCSLIDGSIFCMRDYGVAVFRPCAECRLLLGVLIAPHQLEEADRVPHRMNTAHFVRVDGADRHGRDSEALATRDKEHLGLVFE